MVTAHSQILPANFLVWGQAGAPILPGPILPIYQPRVPLQRRSFQGGLQQTLTLYCRTRDLHLENQAHMLGLVFKLPPICNFVSPPALGSLGVCVQGINPGCCSSGAKLLSLANLAWLACPEASPRDAPVLTSPELGLQACTATPDLSRVLILANQALYCLTRLLSPS